MLKGIHKIYLCRILFSKCYLFAYSLITPKISIGRIGSVKVYLNIQGTFNKFVEVWSNSQIGRWSQHYFSI